MIEIANKLKNSIDLIVEELKEEKMLRVKYQTALKVLNECY